MSERWLLYRSHPRVTPWPAAILDIVRSCERNNSALGVSGMLLYANDLYLQLLEGSEAALADVRERIARDDRHTLIWDVAGEAEPALTGLPMGYFDCDREQAAVPLPALWRDRAGWQADRAADLREMAVALARAKYPSIAQG